MTTVLSALWTAVRAIGWRGWMALVLVALLAWGTWTLRTHWMSAGRAEVQAQWDKQKEQDAATNAQESAAQAAAALAADRLKATQNEGISHEDAQYTQKLESSNARLSAANRGLLDTIARLNTQQRGSGTNLSPSAGTGGEPDDAAAVARELLGQCSSRYTAMAATSGDLARQVIGLQAWTRMARNDNSESEGK